MLKYFQVLVIAFLLASVAYLQPYRLVVVVGKSMEPTYHSGQILLAQRTLEINRGDVVVIKSYDFATLIKRVVYLPGEKYFYIYQKNDKLPLLIPDNTYSNVEKYKKVYGKSILELKVPINHYYVLGDNLPESDDSRSFGTIEQNQILYKIVK